MGQERQVMQDQAAQRFVERIGSLESDSAPLYLQLKRLIQDAISSNLLRAGEALPPACQVGPDAFTGSCFGAGFGAGAGAGAAATGTTAGSSKGEGPGAGSAAGVGTTAASSAARLGAGASPSTVLRGTGASRRRRCEKPQASEPTSSRPKPAHAHTGTPRT